MHRVGPILVIQYTVQRKGGTSAQRLVPCYARAGHIFAQLSIYLVRVVLHMGQDGHESEHNYKHVTHNITSNLISIDFCSTLLKYWSFFSIKSKLTQIINSMWLFSKPCFNISHKGYSIRNQPLCVSRASGYIVVIVYRKRRDDNRFFTKEETLHLEVLWLRSDNETIIQCSTSITFRVATTETRLVALNRNRFNTCPAINKQDLYWQINGSSFPPACRTKRQWVWW